MNAQPKFVVGQRVRYLHGDIVGQVVGVDALNRLVVLLEGVEGASIVADASLFEVEYDACASRPYIVMRKNGRFSRIVDGSVEAVIEDSD